MTETRFNNNFDFLRIAAALMVLVNHSYALLQLVDEDPLHMVTGAMSFGAIGVSIFFIVSGFLITKSWLNHPSVTRFYWNRILRIAPGLFGVAFFTVLIIGPLITSSAIMDYWLSSETWGYFRVVTILGILPHTPTLPGVFALNPYPNVVNGSLWTLPFEFLMYILISILGYLGLLTKRNLLLVGTVAVAIAYTIIRTSVPSTISVIIGYQLFFLIGSIYYLFSEKIAYNSRSLLMIFILWIFSFKTMMFYPATLICLPYIVLCFAHIPIPYICDIGKYGDFSYGVYIYAFLIQQTLIATIENLSPLILVMLSTVATFPCAALSWVLIESRALKLKNIDILSKTIFKRDTSGL